MRIAIISIIIMFFLVGFCHVHAAIDWDFYDDGTIGPGDEYSNVGVYDTPPDHTTVDMLGGIVDSMAAFDESTVNMTGGTVQTLRSANSSTVNVFGGSVYQLSAYDTGTVNVSDNADVFSLVASEYGVVNVLGGSVDHLAALDFGTVNLSGGVGIDYLVAEDSGLVNVFGFNLNKMSTGGGYGYGFVTGKWSDEAIFSIDFSVAGAYSRTELYEIPEPCTLAIVMTSLLFLRRRRS